MGSQELSKLLADNLRYYANGKENKRCATNGGCTYSGETLNLDTEGCFVGRLLAKEDRIELDRFVTENQLGGSLMTVVAKLKEIPNEIKMPDFIIENVEMFSQFQTLHDGKEKWENGCLLSESGKHYLKGVIYANTEILNIEDFREFLK